MEVLNMVPISVMGGFYQGLGFCLLAIGFYYMGKAAWLTIRRRYYYES